MLQPPPMLQRVDILVLVGVQGMGSSLVRVESFGAAMADGRRTTNKCLAPASSELGRGLPPGTTGNGAMQSPAGGGERQISGGGGEAFLIFFFLFQGLG